MSRIQDSGFGIQGSGHVPVMLPEVLEAMRPSDGGIYVDGTFGAGGYSAALLNAARCTVYAIDRDPNVEVLARKLSAQFPGRFFWLLGNFSDMLALLDAQGVKRVSGVVLDIGVSSMQLDTAKRGFSFRSDGPLDMRMGEGGQTAADIVATASEEELADILYHYGEERHARKVARSIVKARGIAPITTTTELAGIVRKVLHGAKGIDPATRTFQGLRIAVNDELGELEHGLEAAEKLLAPGGRLIVVTFHSLEDRIVKRFLQSRSGETGGGSRHLPHSGETRDVAAARPPIFLLRQRKPVAASAAEIHLNPRARSAKLRWAERNAENT